MGKSLFIAEKPSVAQAFGATLSSNLKRQDGYLEDDKIIVTWCYGHLVTMSMPEAYDEQLKKWRMETLPILPKEYKYEIIGSAAKQFRIVGGLLNREDVETIYICTDAGREGEYIYRLVRQMAGVHDKEERRVWIDSQTEDEIKRGIREAKDISAYNNLSDAAYLRAKSDWLMGMNFSRALSIKYGNTLASCLGERYSVIAVGRVMTCVLGMVVRREREIRAFVKTPFYRVLADTDFSGSRVAAEWKVLPGSAYEDSPLLYSQNGFKEKKDAIGLTEKLMQLPEGTAQYDDGDHVETDLTGIVSKIERKKEKKNPPLLYNLADLQLDCSKYFKISPADTLNIIQELYENKLVTYPRTDARVLSTAVAKEISRNISGLKALTGVAAYANDILDRGLYKNIAKTRYTDDKKVTDHYAVIPTGQGIGGLAKMKPICIKVYELIVRRFLAIFYEPAEYQKCSLTIELGGEFFTAGDKYLESPGYLKVMNYSFKKKKSETASGAKDSQEEKTAEEEEDRSADEEEENPDLSKVLSTLKKGDPVHFTGFSIKEGETTPPKRYNSGSLVSAMENAGQFIEDEDLRAQIKGSGIGTSATRADILSKLYEKDKYLALNKKTQIVTPTLKGEMIFDIVGNSVPSLLNAELTASWETGLTRVEEGSISNDEYMTKLESFVTQRTDRVKGVSNQQIVNQSYRYAKEFYK